MANLDTRYDIDNRVAAFENHERGTLISLAGPGTGKTYALLRRAAALTSPARGADPDTICYLTFIKEIANAFVSDYIDTFGQEAYDHNKPRISTLHSFACRLLRNWGYRVGYDGVLYFSNTADRHSDAADTFLADLLPLATRDGCRTVAQLRAHIETIKEAWRDLDDPAGLPAPVPAILATTLPLLRAFRLVDWDQTIPLASGLLNDDLSPNWIAKINHYFIDEFQDFNAAEQELIARLAADANSVVVVGDDDQSVYSTRGGSPEGMRALYEEASHDTVSLSKCRRCMDVIVQMANRFESGMRPDPRPMVSHSSGGEVLCYRFKSAKAEVAYLVTYLTARVAELPPTPVPKDGAVCLFPSHRVLDSYFERLSSLVPCARRGKTVPPARRWLERALRLIATPHQRFIERLLLNDYDELKPRHRQRMITRILADDISPSAACAALVADESFTAKAAQAARAFYNLCDSLSSRDPARIVPLFAQVLSVAEAAVTDHLARFLLTVEEPEQDDFIAAVCDALLPDTAAPREDPRAVLFLTMHGSKGLTKRTVVLPGLEQAWLPGGASGEDLAERQRLFYVAITRATDRILITFPRTRARNDSLNFDAPGRGEASTFVTDAGLECVYHE